MFSRILVAVDGSPTSDNALRIAAGLANPGVELKVVTVADNPAYLISVRDDAVYPIMDDLRQQVLEQAKAVLASAQSQLESMDVKAGYQLIDQTLGIGRSVADGLLSAAQEWHADMLVVGTHGRRGVRRMLLGSVAEQIIRTSYIPVLSVRHPDVSASARQSAEAAFAEWPEEVMGG